MVGVAQLVESLAVDQVVVGSNPIAHPKKTCPPAALGYYVAAARDRASSAADNMGR